MANTYKVKRGMVFWYNLDERINKNSAPAIIVNGKEYPDHRQYGMRHWLVTSNNIGNCTSPTCNVVPITGAYGKANIPTHVPVTFRRRKFEVLCEQIMTINLISLQDYAYTLSETDLRNVEKALMVQFDLSKTQSDADADMEPMLPKARQRIEGYEKRLPALLKSEELKLQVAAQKTLESKQTAAKKDFQHPTRSNCTETKKPAAPQVPANKKLSQIDKFNARYPDVAPKPKTACKETEEALKKEAASQTSVVSANAEQSLTIKKSKWTKELMEEFLRDTDTLPPMQTVKKWGMKDMHTVYSMKYYLQNRLDSLAQAN